MNKNPEIFSMQHYSQETIFVIFSRLFSDVPFANPLVKDNKYKLN